MRTKIGVQDPTSYAIWPMIVMGVIIVGIILGIIAHYLYKKFKKPKKPKPVVVKPAAVNVPSLKSRYIKQLDELANDFAQEKITLRIGFQRMSSIIRNFVFEATGIKVQNYTLDEIRSIGLPKLDELVTEYYNPEFAKMSEGDFVESMLKTKKVIEQWK